MASTSSSKRIRNPNPINLDQFPEELISIIIQKQDLVSIQSMASTCTTFRALANHIRPTLPNFHITEVALTLDELRQLLPINNPYLRSLKLDCTRLRNLASVDYLFHPPLTEVCLFNCFHLQLIMFALGHCCKNLRFLCLSSAALPLYVFSANIAYLDELLTGCTQLETLIFRGDFSMFPFSEPDHVALALSNLISLEIDFISSVQLNMVLNPVLGSPHPPILPNIQNLCLSLDYITDTTLSMISQHLISLTHLDLRDCPSQEEPSLESDLTNIGLQLISERGKLKHLSLVRSQRIVPSFFKRVNDIGIFLMAENCSVLESICLGGFCHVTDTGYQKILRSCSKLYKLGVFFGTHLTDLVVNDIAGSSVTLTHVNLRWCNLLTDLAVKNLALNLDLSMLDLRGCRNLGDKALRTINGLPKLKTLILDGCDVSDVGLSYLSEGLMNSLVSLSVRGCKKLTDRGIRALFDGNSNREIRELDISCLPNLTDEALLFLAETGIPISELRMRHCPLIGNSSVMALARMRVDKNLWCGSSLKLLDLYDTGRFTQLALCWLKKPYFPRLRMLGVTGSENEELVNRLARNRPCLRIESGGEELATDFGSEVIGGNNYKDYAYLAGRCYGHQVPETC